MKVDRMQAQSCSNILWALAKLQTIDTLNFSQLFDQLLVRTDAVLNSFTSQQASNVIWAYAKITEGKRSGDQKLLLKLARHCLKQKGNSQDYDNAVWSLATLELRDVQVFSDLVNRCGQLYESMPPQGIANVLWSCGKMRFYDEALFKRLYFAGSRKVYDFNGQHLANALWTCAQFGYQNKNFVDAVLKLAPRICRKSTSGELVTIAWSLAILDVWDNNFWQQMTNKIDETVILADTSASGLEIMKMIYHIKLLADMCNVPEAAEKLVSEKAMQLCRKLWQESESQASKLQQRVYEQIKSLNLGCTELEMKTEDQDMTMDILIKRGNGQTDVVVEVDGPYHFCWNEPNRPLFHFQRRNQLLQYKGYRVVIISYQEVDTQRGDVKQLFLDKLNTNSEGEKG
eukprot:TRINITY_DN33104_c1_g1_i4.p1 TRINITY_DN33104_c1_g1~~TRINITY_DN33104_c1_g1_i4.p1  ORF type:complete len:457 (-),score=40.63 TRINITY_DN33104_c1_g1_i4:461-1660(-)